jgi:hypothetical protein
LQSQKSDETGTDGSYPDIDIGRDNETLRFSATDYLTDDEYVALIEDSNIKNYTYLLPVQGNPGCDDCIAGVIAKAVEHDNKTYYEGVDGIKVYLYKKTGCSWPDPEDYFREDTTANEGCYNFPGLTTETEYKVKPAPNQGTFSPASHQLSIPQSPCNAFDFIKQ